MTAFPYIDRLIKEFSVVSTKLTHNILIRRLTLSRIDQIPGKLLAIIRAIGLYICAAYSTELSIEVARCLRQFQVPSNWFFA